jgi:hypothetical protein
MGVCLTVESIAFLHWGDERVIEAGVDDIPRRSMNVDRSSKPCIVGFALEQVVGEHDDVVVLGKIGKDVIPLLSRDEELKIVFKDENRGVASLTGEFENAQMREGTSMPRTQWTGAG